MTPEEIQKAAEEAFLKAQGGNIEYWNTKVDDPDAKYWMEVWTKGFNAAQSHYEKRIAELEDQVNGEGNNKNAQEPDAWSYTNLGGFEFKCKSDEDADYLKNAYLHYNEKRYTPSINEDNWKMLHDAVSKENATKGLIIVQLRKELEDLRKIVFDLGRVIEWSKNTSPFYSIDEYKDPK